MKKIMGGIKNVVFQSALIMCAAAAGILIAGPAFAEDAQNTAKPAEQTKAESKQEPQGTGYIRIPFGVYLAPGIPTGDNVVNSFAIHLIGSSAARLDGVSLGTGIAILSEDVNGVSLAGIGTIAGKDSRNLVGAGIFNIIHGGFDGVQGAGLFNITTGHVNGIQASGLFNTAGKEVSGVQYAGLLNTAGGPVTGMQASGLLNIASADIKGMQAAGLLNVTSGNGSGLQGAGLMNISGGNFKGFQGAGLMNITAGNVQGFQGAGLMNIAESVQGFQGAGLLNAAKGVKGTQMSVINIAGDVNGAMFGVINVADKLDGFFAGLFTVILNGETYGRVWADETGFIRAGVQHGNKYFYNAYSIGTDYKKEALSIGYTYGAKIPVSKFYVALDASCYSFLKNGSSWHTYHSSSAMQSQIKASAGVNVISRLTLFAGATYNYRYQHDTDDAYLAESKAGYTKSTHNGRHAYWPGFVAGVQF